MDRRRDPPLWHPISSRAAVTAPLPRSGCSSCSRSEPRGCREVPRPRHQRETLQAAGLALDGKQSKLALVKSFSHPGSSALHPS